MLIDGVEVKKTNFVEIAVSLRCSSSMAFI